MGEITYETLLPSGETRGRITNQFNVVVDGCKWSISVKPLGREAAVVSDDVGCDGNNVYRVMVFAKRAVGNQGGSTADSLGMVYPGWVPPADISMISGVWMAYASRCYFAEQVGKRSKPVWQMDDPVILFSGTSFPVHFTFSDEPPHLLSGAEFLSEGLLHRVTNEVTVVSRTEKPPFDKGYSIAAYQAFSWKSTPAIPETFALTRFLPDYTSPPKTRPWVVMKGRLLEVGKIQGGASDYRPTVKAGMEVQDFRTMTLDPPLCYVSYSLPENAWPNLDAKWLSSKYHLLVSSRPVNWADTTQHSPGTKRLWAIRATLIITFLGGLGLLLYFSRNRINWRSRS